MLLALFSPLGGCGKDAANLRPNAIGGTSIASNQIASSDSCSIALAEQLPDEGQTPDQEDIAIDRHQSAVKAAPHRIGHLESLGWSFVAKARKSRDPGYYTLALETGRCIDSRFTNSNESLLLRGHALHNLHRFTEAEDISRRLVERRGIWFDHALRGDVLLELGRVDDAIEHYQVVADVKPGPQAYARVSKVRFLTGDVDGAVALMSLAAKSTSPRMQEPKAWAYVQLALLHMEVDQLEDAESAVSIALETLPTYAPALHAKGRLLLAQGKTAAAVSSLEQAVKNDAQPEFLWTLIEALREDGQYQIARSFEDQLLTRGGTEDPRTLSIFLATQGAAAAHALHLAEEELKQRQDVFSLDALAWALSNAKQHQKALVHSTEAIETGITDTRLLLHAFVIAKRAGALQTYRDLEQKLKPRLHLLLPSEQRLFYEEFAPMAAQVAPGSI